MSVIRQDPTTNEWVIIATGRDQRPDDFAKVPSSRSPLSENESCPFCPGHESKTPDELFRIDDGASGSWVVRVIPNRFPALGATGKLRRRDDEPLFREMDGVGHHEVIIETPHHDQLMALMTRGQIENILRSYQARYQALRQDPRVRYIIIFKNHGKRAGTSLEHPHSQLVAAPVAPMQLLQKYEVAAGHYDKTGRCLYCDLVKAEERAGTRTVLTTDRFLVFHPFASRAPFETWIAPKEHQPSFGQVSGGDLAALAEVLRKTLLSLYRALGNLDFNYIVHTAPTGDEMKPYYLWHIQILPRLTAIAGFELGSGMYITTMLPEDSAAFVRTLM